MTGQTFTFSLKESLKNARELIRISSMHSNIPEPLRVSHMIATGVVKGESTKKP